MSVYTDAQKMIQLRYKTTMDLIEKIDNFDCMESALHYLSVLGRARESKILKFEIFPELKVVKLNARSLNTQRTS